MLKHPVWIGKISICPGILRVNYSISIYLSIYSRIFIILPNYEGYLCAYSTNSRKTAALHSFRLLRIWARSVDADTGFTT